MIYLYGLLKPDPNATPETSLARIDGVTGPVALETCGDLVLVHGPHDGSEIMPRRRSLLTHARVLETMMEFGTVLPMRFGMTCRSTGAFASLAEAGAERIDDALERLEGHVEIGVRVVAEEEASLAAALATRPDLAATRDRLLRVGNAGHFAKVDFGRALGEVVAERRRKAQRDLLAWLTPRALSHVLKAPETDFEILRAEFLIEKDSLPDFAQRLEDGVGRLDFADAASVTTRIVGPGPAFHFVDLSLTPADADEAA